MKYEYLTHTADVKIRAFGKTLEEAFLSSAYAVKNEFTSQKTEDKFSEKINIVANSKEALFYDFIDTIIFYVDSDKRIISSIKNIDIKEDKKNKKWLLNCVFHMDDITEFNTLIKAMTYQEMNIEKKDKEWVIEFIVDV